MRIKGITLYELTLLKMGVQMAKTEFKKQNEFFERQGNKDYYTERMYQEFLKLSEKLQKAEN